MRLETFTTWALTNPAAPSIFLGMNLTPAQRAALRSAADYGAISDSLGGVRFATAQSLADLGLVRLIVGKRNESLAPSGWTGRVYVSQAWTGFLTPAGREALEMI